MEPSHITLMETYAAFQEMVRRMIHIGRTQTMLHWITNYVTACGNASQNVRTWHGPGPHPAGFGMSMTVCAGDNMHRLSFDNNEIGAPMRLDRYLPLLSKNQPSSVSCIPALKEPNAGECTLEHSNESKT